MSYFLLAGLPEAGLQREVSIEGESDFCREKSMAWKESGEPAARTDLGEELGQGQVVIELPEAEVPSLESVEGFLSQVVDINGQIVEERSVHYVEGPPVSVLEECPNSWEGDSKMGMRLRGRPEDRDVRPKPQLWKRRWRHTLGWRLLTFPPYSRGQH